MANPTLTIEITQKGADGVVTSLKQIEKQGNTTYTKVLKDGQVVSEQTRVITGQHKSQYGAITAISTGYLAAATAYGVVKGGLDGLIAAGIEELDSIRNRDVALKNAGDTTLQYKGALEKQAQQFMTSLGVADDYTREIQAQLLIQHKAPSDIEMMTQATMGLTLQQGIGSEAAAKQIARFVEFGGTLRGTTLKADANSTAQSRMKQAYDFTTTGIEAQRKKMQESEGKIDAARVKYGELREELGLRLLPAVSDLAAGFGTVLDKYNALDPAAQNMVLWSVAAVAALKPLGVALGGIITSMKWLLANPIVLAGAMVSAAGAGGAAATTPEFRGWQSQQSRLRNYLKSQGETIMPITKVHGKQDIGAVGWTLGNERAVNQYGQTTSKNWLDKANDIYASPVGQIAQAGLSGGGIGGMLTAAGGAFGGPIGALLGGALGKFFGGHKKPRGETPAQPLYTQDIRLGGMFSEMLNIMKIAYIRAASGGIDGIVKQIGMQNARAGV